MQSQDSVETVVVVVAAEQQQPVTEQQQPLAIMVDNEKSAESEHIILPPKSGNQTIEMSRVRRPRIPSCLSLIKQKPSEGAEELVLYEDVVTTRRFVTKELPILQFKCEFFSSYGNEAWTNTESTIDVLGTGSMCLLVHSNEISQIEIIEPPTKLCKFPTTGCGIDDAIATAATIKATLNAMEDPAMETKTKSFYMPPGGWFIHSAIVARSSQDVSAIAPDLLFVCRGQIPQDAVNGRADRFEIDCVRLQGDGSDIITLPIELPSGGIRQYTESKLVLGTSCCAYRIPGLLPVHGMYSPFAPLTVEEKWEFSGCTMHIVYNYVVGYQDVVSVERCI